MTPSTRWSTDTKTHNLCTNVPTSTHTHTHVYKRIDVQIHTHVHIYTYIMSAHIHTHAYKMHIWTHAKHVWNDDAAATAREARLDAKKLCPSPCPLQSGGGYPSWPAAQSPVRKERRIRAEQPQLTAAHHTITTARRPDHIRLSALVRSQSTQFIVHASSQLGHGPPKRGHFSAILAVFFPWITGNLIITQDLHQWGRTNFGPAQTTEQPGHKPLVVNVVVAGSVRRGRGGDRCSQRRS